MAMRRSESQSKDDIITIVRLLFDSARTSVRLSTALTSDLVDGAAPEIRAALERVKTFDVLLDGRVNSESIQKRFNWLFDNPKVSISQARGAIPHWIIIDDRDFRLEKVHEVPAPGQNMTGWEPRANMTVIDATPAVASELLVDFAAFGKDARPIKSRP